LGLDVAGRKSELQSMSWNEREDDYSSVAFWYQTGEPTFDYRAPDAHARRLPSLEHLIVAATNFADAQFHGEGEATRNNWIFTTIRNCSTSPPPRRGVAGNALHCHQ
jgi:hypothetical protein